MSWFRRSKGLDSVLHDLQSPLAAIDGYSQMLLKSAEKGKVDPKLVKTLQFCSQQALGLAQDLMDRQTLARGKFKLKRKPCKIDDLVEQCCRSFDPICQAKGITLVVEKEDDLPTVFADSRRIAQVVSNLLSNALRHTPEGGTIAARFQTDGELVRVLVQDTGDGMEPGQALQIFDEFYQGENGGALGLGLAICREIISRHGGDIAAHSEGLGCGSTFHFTIPVNPTVAYRLRRRETNWPVYASIASALAALMFSLAVFRPDAVELLASLRRTQTPVLARLDKAAQAPARELSDAPAALPAEAAAPVTSPAAAGREVPLAVGLEDQSAKAAKIFDGNALYPGAVGVGSLRFTEKPSIAFSSAPLPRASAVPPAPPVRVGMGRLTPSQENRKIYAGLALACLIAAPLFLWSGRNTFDA